MVGEIRACSTFEKLSDHRDVASLDGDVERGAAELPLPKVLCRTCQGEEQRERMKERGDQYEGGWGGRHEN